MYQRVVVTVKRKDEARVRDLEVPVNLTAERLAEMIARALRWETDMTGQRITYLIEAHPLGRMLQPDETLAGAGVWDGSWLVLHPMQAGAEVAAPTIESPIPAPGKQAPPVTPSATQGTAPPVPAPIPIPAPEEEAWAFPATPTQAAGPEPVVSQPEQADSSALLEMLLGGGAAPTPVEEKQPPPAEPMPAPIEETPPLVPGFQAAEEPTPSGPEAWNFPMVTAPLPAEPEPQAPSTRAEEQPAESNSLLEMLLGGTSSGPPTTQAPEPLPEALAPSWPYPAEPEPQPAGTKDDIWTFPVASSAEVQAVQPPPAEEEEEEETQPAPAPTPSPFDAWAFPVAPEQPAETTPEQPTYTPEPAPAQADGESLLEMLLGGAPAAPTEGAAQPQPAPPPEPQPDTSQAAASAQPQQQAKEKDKSKPLTEPKVGGFRPLGIELPPETEPPPDEKKPRFVWKKLDE